MLKLTQKNVLNSEKEQEIYREESDTRKAERRVKQEQVENNAAKNKISEDVTDSAVTSSAEGGNIICDQTGEIPYIRSVYPDMVQWKKWLISVGQMV